MIVDFQTRLMFREQNHVDWKLKSNISTVLLNPTTHKFFDSGITVSGEADDGGMGVCPKLRDVIYGRPFTCSGPSRDCAEFGSSSRKDRLSQEPEERSVESEREKSVDAWTLKKHQIARGCGPWFSFPVKSNFKFKNYSKFGKTAIL